MFILMYKMHDVYSEVHIQLHELLHIYSPMWPPPISIYRILPAQKKAPACLFLVKLYYLLQCNHCPDLCHHWLAFLGCENMCKWSYTLCILLCLASFAQHSSILLCISTVCSFSCLAKFHWISTPQYIYLSCGHLGVFQFLIITNKCATNILVHVFSWTEVLISLVCVYPRVGLLA